MASPRIAAWIRQEDYDAFRRIASDLPDTFDEWFQRATRDAGKLQASGTSVEKVLVDPQKFEEYCSMSGLEGSYAVLNAFAITRDRQHRVTGS